MDTAQILKTVGSASDFVNALLNGNLDEGAQRVHGMWYSLKEQELKSQDSPFRGVVPVGSRFEGAYRVKVKDLTADEREELLPLLIRFDTGIDGKDVYHSLFAYQETLLKTNEDAARMNRVPVGTVLVGLADLFRGVNIIMFAKQIGEMIQLAELENWKADNSIVTSETKLKLSDDDLLKRQNQLDSLVRLVHSGWVSAVLATGKTPQEDENIAVFDNLSGWMTQYDKDIAVELMRWILEQVSEVHSKKV